MWIVVKAAPDGYTLLMGSSAQCPRRNRMCVGGRLRALGTPEFREQFNAQGVELMQSTPVVFGEYVKG